VIISKHFHSCLLIKEKGKTIVIDPGNYTEENQGLDSNKLQTLDYILITHEHADHCYIPLIKKLIEKFPNVIIITNKSVGQILSKNAISYQTTDKEGIELAATPHEKVFGMSVENTLFTVFNRLIHPGDSQSFSKTSEIVAIPMQAPWGSYVISMELAIKLKPKFVLPIHDFHWRDDFRKAMYDRTESYLKNYGITFKKMETGEEIEI